MCASKSFKWRMLNTFTRANVTILDTVVCIEALCCSSIWLCLNKNSYIIHICVVEIDWDDGVATKWTVYRNCMLFQMNCLFSAPQLDGQYECVWNSDSKIRTVYRIIEPSQHTFSVWSYKYFCAVKKKAWHLGDEIQVTCQFSCLRAESV